MRYNPARDTTLNPRYAKVTTCINRLELDLEKLDRLSKLLLGEIPYFTVQIHDIIFLV